MERGIDCIVINYKTPQLTNKFIKSFEDSSFKDASLYVIDNGPLDGQDLNVDNCYYGLLPENVGYAKACNLGAAATVERSNREILAFFNSDCELQPETLREMYDGMIRRKLDIAGPLQYDSQGRVTHGGIMGSQEKPQHRGWRSQSLNAFRDVQQAVSVSGSAYFIRREVWDELTACPLYRDVAPDALGAFLPTRHYYEETFCSYHAQAHGYDVTYYGQAEMIHEWHKSSPTGGVEDKEYMSESRKFFRAACDHHNIEHD